MNRLSFLWLFLLLGFLSSIAQQPLRSRVSSREPQPIGVATRAQERWADRVLRSLTLEEKLGQMIEVRGIMAFYNTDDPVFQKLVADIRKYHLGAVHLTVNVDGPLLVRTEPYEAAMTVRRLQMESHGRVPLIFSVDFAWSLHALERGGVLSAPMAFGATHNPAYAEQFGKIVAEESRALGIAWNFFPIADV